MSERLRRLHHLLPTLGVASLLVAGAGCGGGGPWVAARYAASVNGATTIFRPKDWGSARTEVVASRAAKDLDCPLSEIAVEPHEQVDVARGCGRAIPEAVVSYLDRYATRRVTVVPVWEGASPGRYLAGFGENRRDARVWKVGDEEFYDRSYAVERLVLLERLAAAGAHDLGCPAGEVAPEIVSGEDEVTPLAEGCGRRATYLLVSDTDLRLVSRVDLAPPAPGTSTAATEPP